MEKILEVGVSMSKEVKLEKFEPLVSVIIPVYNERETLKEIMVVKLQV